MDDARQPLRSDPQPVARHRVGPHPVVEALAFCLPFAGALSQTRGEPLWRSDAAALAALEGVTPFQGGFSTLLSRVALALPLGNHGFRMATPGALFAGLVGLSTLLLCHTLFRRQGGYSRLDPWLALGASLSASLSLPWMTEAGVAGGAAVGAGLAMFLLYRLIDGGLPRTLPGATCAGVLLGVLFTESWWAASLVVTAALVVWPESGVLLKKKRDRGHVLRIAVTGASAAASGALLLLPAVLSHSLVALHGRPTASSESIWPLWSALEWIGSIGFLWTAGALFALLFSLDDKRPLYACGLVVLSDVFAPGNGGDGWTGALFVDANRLALHLTALALIAPAGALGLRTLGESAQALRLFAARPLAAMVAVLAIAGCLASAEDSLRRLSQTGTSGPQAWTDEALQNLPDHALVLTTTPAWGRRLLAAQALGERPDVLVVPLGDVTRPETLEIWLEQEPQLETLLRDLSVSENPSERAMTRLVDTRPVVHEPNPAWDRRLLEHVLPTLPLAHFSPHALGRSDRLAALETIPEPRERIVRGYEDGLHEDAATRAALRAGFDQMKGVLDAIKDGKSSRTLDELRPQGPTNDSDGKKLLAPVAAL